MQTAVRSYFTAGVALAGAGVIAVSPVAPTPTDIGLPAIHASSAAVTLNALTNPLDAWVQTLTKAGTNLQALGEQLMASPAPILQTVIRNQIGNATVIGNAVQSYGDLLGTTLQGLPAALQEASDLINQGQITKAMDGLTNALLPAIVGVLDLMNGTWSAVDTTTQNIQNVIAAVPTLVQSVALPALYPVLSVVNGLAATAEEVVTAANAGDTEGVVNAFINAPANLTDAFLNGKGTILGFINTPGLLSPESGFGFLGDGPITSILNIPKTIAGLLDPNPQAPATATVATVNSAKLASSPVKALSSGVSARTVTLSAPAAETADEPASAATDSDAATTADSPAASAQADDSASDSTEAKAPAPAKTATATATAGKTAVKKPTATANPAQKIRDNIKKATQRLTGKTTETGKRSSAAGKARHKSGH
ncbi:hypothetical protein [Mycolicibacterium senegalense]|uniref:PE-PGRS family protein n=2 Tax=Mycolicibacterium TaxID=1866885 RepID=A0A378W8B9_9MYCO|nr:hypothetical protein [Mycolicibacterium senegalense]MCV7337269.1 hypothetical protein [Mycolicibacterium senegalense]MDR7287107.1 hypothetical protein [Mycolicibacterium senegalense]QZA24216.1 hypothetical protein K3U95_26930 [Mycolicibacterium senegalense]SUA29315.1 PE-PGRS family protein [Mycolicibacterium senegalense]